jgi:PAS domain S-box-containing protein
MTLEIPFLWYTKKSQETKVETNMFNKSKKTEKTDNSRTEHPEDSQVDSQIKKLKFEIAELKAIQSAMPDPYYVRDMDYNVILWPPAIAKLTGYSEAEAKKLKCYEMYKACVCPPLCECPTQKCVQTHQFLRDVAVDIYHKSGATVHTLVSNAGVYDEDGNPIGAVEIVKDNTVIEASMGSIGKLISKIDQLASSLLGIMEKVGITSHKVDDKAHESLNSIVTGVKAGNSVSERTGHSGKYASSVRTNMQTINESMKFSIDKISTLKEKSEIIIQIVTVIQEIAAKTNLLAINASIEAAHAGETGKGFKVVADGIRELSKNSSESAMTIKKTIQEIISLVQETTVSLNNTEKNILTGTNNISELLGSVNDIDSAAKVLLGILTTIENAASTTSALGDEQNISVEEMSRTGKELSEIAQHLTREFDRVFKAIQHQDMG